LPRIVKLQFTNAGKMYDFNAGDLNINLRDKVIVETERGMSIGTVVEGPLEKEVAELPADLVSIIRVATAVDMDAIARNAEKEKEAYDFCNQRIIERNMEMKLVRVEYLFDSSKAIFYFTADGRVDFRDLVKDLAHAFHTRIEMRQIGVRDESKMIGGIGICGRELCCCSFLRDFQPVSVKMAKEQNLALNPSKISGQCGRLLCCLDYEYETYCNLKKSFPKCGKRVSVEAGSGVIDKQNLLTGVLTIKLDDGKLVNVKKQELREESATEQTQKKPEVNTTEKPTQTRRERPPRTPRQQEQPSKKAEPSAPRETAVNPVVTDDKTQKTEGRSSKKKSRSRRHGHRKPGKPQETENKNTD